MSHHTTVTATAFARKFSDFLNQVCYQGVTIDVKRGNEIIACVSRPTTQPVTQPGFPIAELDRLLSGLPRLTADEAMAFARDIDEASSALSNPTNPWDE